jgi:hypothetical protein
MLICVVVLCSCRLESMLATRCGAPAVCVAAIVRWQEAGERHQPRAEIRARSQPGEAALLMVR